MVPVPTVKVPLTGTGTLSPRVRYGLALPGEPASTAAARGVVREALTAAGRTEWVDAAELACTELVSNVVLHAHTDLELTVEVFADVARVLVRDFSPALPAQRGYDEQATTGRGMTLVAALTSAHGVSDVGPGGKTVWFTLTGDPAAQTEEELLAAWEDADWPLDELLVDEPPPGERDSAVQVRLLGLPPTLWLAARQHHDALLRELVLHLAEHGDEDLAVDLAAADRARATVSSAVAAAVEQAQRLGTTHSVLPAGHPSPLPSVPEPLDLELSIPEDLGAAFGAMQDTLDLAERLAASGRLLARPGLPEIVAVRDWACEQITAQLAGVPPAPWPGADQERFTLDGWGAARNDLDWDVAVVRESPRGVVAADDANRIVAISRPLADALGWGVDDLVGRRVVTLIPHRLREAHVAGFTRHLTTGETHALDVPLRLPVLRADGGELVADFLVQRAPTPGGRAVYFAWIEPVAEASRDAP